ncbi:PIG-L family deacetylase [Neolewinella lacunae]|uniref:PIG-L family deacetylase n=1 Tax=Neolewinella lacunae TaxID=1517758 RepID=A0A923PIT4_9BACT|nr:PIG-L family deacetylase [Neolewinella lacunae]MBC6994860.1 PIG-L family deacetylase [Neolewinella lacunae]MDN3636780.1 PIG-L family deacetylase [Neolewinella lacunae]
MKHFVLIVSFVLLTTFSLFAQIASRPTAGDLHAGIQKLQVLGSALYLAAHPDDENTRLIAYLANVDKVETAYLSLTRGDGGQNLIAPDIRELLGLTRTQELLAARRIDGGSQFFSRANDFGYSKHSDETFTIWDKQKVLADAVWVIRQWRPDVIVLRFDPRDPGSTHGHHTASAIIGLEAFDLAGDPTAFPEQLKYVEPWQPRRIYWNAYTWRGVPEHMVQENIIKVDVGTYLPKRGEGVSEIAARSRSQHKSQGFGSAGSRGEAIEQLELLKGDDNDVEGEVFGNIDITWNRIPGGTKIGQVLQVVEDRFRFDDPAASVPDLLRVRKMLQDLPDGFWKSKKLAELEEIIAGTLGLYLAGTTDDPIATAGQNITVKIEATNRSTQPVKLIDYFIEGTVMTRATVQEVLATNRPFTQELTLMVQPGQGSSGPYWLLENGELGMYRVDEQELRGKGESDDPLQVTFQLDIAGEEFFFTRPVRHAYTDPVKGEQVQPLEVLPPVFVELGESSYLFTGSEAQPVRVKLTAARADLRGNLELCIPNGWKVSPEKVAFHLERKGQEQYFSFALTPPAGQVQGTIVPLARLEGDEDPERGYTRKLVKIDHDHLPVQLADLDASVPVAKIDLAIAGRNIGYLPGAGDAIPEALTNIGFQVTTLDKAAVTTGSLRQFDAIVVGVRAYNTIDDIANYQPRLLQYVKDGGTLVVQYNTSRGVQIPMTELGPYPFQLSSDRVTVEDAEVRILAPDHPVLNYPNKITSADFAGWVQERGLYFPSNWAPEYTAIISSNDPGEQPLDGGLLVAPYGKGHYVYTGYSFFRELPAGVPGAYRLFANLVGLGNEVRP